MVGQSVNDFIASALSAGETTELSGGASGLMRRPSSRRFTENSRGRVVSRRRSEASRRAYEENSRIRAALARGQAMARSGSLHRRRREKRSGGHKHHHKKGRRRSARLAAGTEAAAAPAAEAAF